MVLPRIRQLVTDARTANQAAVRMRRSGSIDARAAAAGACAFRDSCMTQARDWRRHYERTVTHGTFANPRA